MKHIVGLGNPGLKYKKTRHNIGFLVLDFLASKEKWQKSKNANALYLLTNINNEEVELLKPQTFMNNSGNTVAYIKKKHPQMSPQDLIVIHDDVDLPVGKIKISQNTSSAGHKGVNSIIEHFGNKDFLRIRIGVGKSDDLPTDVYVLKKFARKELKLIEDNYSKIQEIISTIINEGADTAMNKFN